jgi:NADH-quinone oxidoreductase subunit M
MLPTISDLLPAVAVLAVFGAAWATLKALTQESVPQKLSYGGIALYSIFWWNVASTGSITSYAMLFLLAVLLVTGGLWFAWGRVRTRYGDLSINHIGGLFKPMPKFALCMALLVMAATGLPPFGLFFGYIGMLLGSTAIPSLGFWVVLAVWFAGSWYLFQLMRHVLFGPHREDLRYEDLKPAEIAVLACIVICLVALSLMPQDWFTIAAATEVARVTGGTP